MTTKLQHPISPLARAPHNSFPVNPLIIITHLRYSKIRPGLAEPNLSMDRTLDNQNIDSMRRTMMLHEEIFKHQVRELHRLYNLQKKLMHEVNATETGHGVQTLSAREDPRELNGSCRGESSRMAINFDLERPVSSNIHLPEEEKDLKKIVEEGDVDVELTLSIGHCPRKQKQHLQQQQQQHNQDRSDPQQPSSAVSSSSSVSVYHEDSRPRWLLQDLSINRT